MLTRVLCALNGLTLLSTSRARALGPGVGGTLHALVLTRQGLVEVKGAGGAGGQACV